MNLDLVTVDKSRFLDDIKAYFLWKELDMIIKMKNINHQKKNGFKNFKET